MNSCSVFRDRKRCEVHAPWLIRVLSLVGHAFVTRLRVGVIGIEMNAERLRVDRTGNEPVAGPELFSDGVLTNGSCELCSLSFRYR